MLNLLRQRARWRGAVGIMAAYALALQMLLAGMAGAQLAAADPAAQSVICYGASDAAAADHGQNPGAPRIHHVTCVVCGTVSLTPPLAEAATPVVFRAGTTAAYVSVDGRRHVAARRHEPKSARGPPQTV
jgi:hypothetical protein